MPLFLFLQIICPHLLRYLAVAVITSKNKQKISLKDLIRVIEVVSILIYVLAVFRFPG
jgi:hypothetical protein